MEMTAAIMTDDFRPMVCMIHAAGYARMRPAMEKHVMTMPMSPGAMLSSCAICGRTDEALNKLNEHMNPKKNKAQKQIQRSLLFSWRSMMP